MNQTYILIAGQVAYIDIVGRIDRRARQFHGDIVITSWGRQSWSRAHQLTIL